MYSRRVSERSLTFRFNMRTHKSNLLLTDVETGSVWSQLELAAIDGPLTGTGLTVIPSLQTTWSHWKSLHPETRVVDPKEGGYPFRYAEAISEDASAAAQPAELEGGELVLGLTIQSASKAYPFRELAASALPIRDTVSGQTVLIHFDHEPHAAWATDEDGRLLPGMTVYWFAWKNFHPDTAVYRAS